MIVKLSQKAMSSLVSLPRNIKAKARRTVETLKSDDKDELQPTKLNGERNLYSGRIDSKHRVIYSENRNTITIVDIINIDFVVRLMQSESCSLGPKSIQKVVINGYQPIRECGNCSIRSPPRKK